jgi:hypothetical protein
MFDKRKKHASPIVEVVETSIAASWSGAVVAGFLLSADRQGKLVGVHATGRTVFCFVAQ